MKYAVYKYVIPERYYGKRFDLTLPVGAVPFAFHDQMGVAALWARISIGSSAQAPRPFICATTGMDFSCGAEEIPRPIGTALLMRGSFVLHLFEVVPA